MKSTPYGESPWFTACVKLQFGLDLISITGPLSFIVVKEFFLGFAQCSFFSLDVALFTPPRKKLGDVA